MRARVLVELKPGMLDPEGATVKRALKNLGFSEVEDVHVGKVVELELDSEDEEAARERVKEMCGRLLANPVIHSYEIEIG
ncbi:MAG: Phosphoribosylformylglycinamidine synthase subunit PurS [Methanonatronarchaeales archaeon]|nr:Phosphoribosylformylglycinamidine synthase subunit PurS [Methanonatronarchaeales archaeon]